MGHLIPAGTGLRKYDEGLLEVEDEEEENPEEKEVKPVEVPEFIPKESKDEGEQKDSVSEEEKAEK